MKQNFTHKGLARLYFIMRVSIVNVLLLLIPCLQMLNASPARGQDVHSTLVDVHAEHASLKTIFSLIENKTDFLFVYPPSLVDIYSDISVNSDSSNLGSLLDDLFFKINLKYYVKDNNIVVFANTPEKERFFLRYTISGIVRDSSTGEPMPGVSIVIKDSNNGTATDSEGHFNLDVVDGDVLVFTFIGYKEFQTEVQGKTSIEVRLVENIESLDEVVINAGYWEIKEREQTGNIARIRSQDISRQPVNNPLQAMIGRLPGVQVTQKSGLPGGSVTFQIRGVNSLREDGNDPLYIVDGVPFPSKSINNSSIAGEVISGSSPLNNISPSDIESIEILKDADATSVYGSRGANGVVLITTKRGRSKGIGIDFNFSSGKGEVPKMMKLLGTSDYLSMRKDVLKSLGLWPVSPEMASLFPDLAVWDTTKYTDWQEELIGNSANFRSAQLSISGGSNNMDYLVSTAYANESTVFPNSKGLDKFSINTVLNSYSKSRKFKISLSNYINYSVNRLPQKDLTPVALTLAPNAPNLYDENGDLNWQAGTFMNPLGDLRQKYENKITNVVSNVSMSYQILPGLYFRNSFGVNMMRASELATFPILSYYPAGDITGSARFSNNNLDSWIWEPQISYTIENNKRRVDFVIGSTMQETKRESSAILGTGYTSDAMIEDVKSAAEISAINSDYSQYRYQGIYARLGYTFLDRYLINFTARRDGSTRFGSNSRYANFGAVGIGWIFSDESFFKNINFVSFGKIRGSYGISGSDQVGDYEYLDTYKASAYPYDGVGGLIPTRLVNPNYGWESNTKLEVGLDLKFFEDKFFVKTSYYRNRSSDQLVGYPLPQITGFSTITSNLDATIQNSGLEIEFNSLNVETDEITWATSFNLTFPKTKLVEYPGIEGSAYANVYSVGSPLSPRTLDYIGVNFESGLYEYRNLNSGEGGGIYPDDLMSPRRVLGQKYFGGLGSDFRYKIIELSLFFQVVKQNARSYQSYWSIPGTQMNQPENVLNRWQEEGDIAGVQRFSLTQEAISAYDNFIYSEGSIVDASYVRLKNVFIACNLPRSIVGKIRASNLQVYIQGQNLLTWTNYVGLDPEAQGGSMPSLRVYTMGVKISF